MADEPRTTDQPSQGLVVEGVSMAFAGRRVLHDVDLTFHPGVVNGLIGHNGSGKSTLVKILAGFHEPETGTCRLGGERLDSPADAARLGLRFVHQDLGLIREFTPLENFGIGGRYSTRGGRIDWAAQRRRMASVFELLESPVPPERPVASLSAVERSLIAIARAIGAPPEDVDALDRARFIVLDEPTTTLEATEADQLFTVIGRMCARGIGALFISHHLSDVLRLCPTVSVLRDGHLVGTFDGKTATRTTLVEAMLGEETAKAERESVKRLERRPASAIGDPAVTVSGLRCGPLRGIDLTVHAGECVAVVGLAGSGREEVVYALSGAKPSEFDRLEIGAETVPRLTPSIAQSHGVALAPGNRLPGSLVSEFAVRENLTLVSLDELAGPLGFISEKRERETVGSWVGRFDIKPADGEYGTRYLSGGNKQKVIMAKWLNTGPRAVFVDEPSAGVDVGAVAMLFESLRAYVTGGGALLMSTSDLNDAIALADRVVVLLNGRIATELVRGTDEISEQSLLLAMDAAPEEALSYQDA